MCGYDDGDVPVTTILCGADQLYGEGERRGGEEEGRGGRGEEGKRGEGEGVTGGQRGTREEGRRGGGNGWATATLVKRTYRV